MLSELRTHGDALCLSIADFACPASALNGSLGAVSLNPRASLARRKSEVAGVGANAHATTTQSRVAFV